MRRREERRRTCALLLASSLCALLSCAASHAQPPAAAGPEAVQPPEHMSYRDMAAMMQMDDTARVGKVMLDQLEWRNIAARDPGIAWDAAAWYGGDYDKLWLKSEGNRAAPGALREADVEALWNRVIGPWWSLQAGARADVGQGPARTWLALGLQGLAPQWIETELTLYASDAGRLAARVKLQYELLLSQRLRLQPFFESNLYSRSDPQRELGSGIADMQMSLRLRYEIRRELAPYLGLLWLKRFGGTAALARNAGGGPGELQLAAGLALWW